MKVRKVKTLDETHKYKSDHLMEVKNFNVKT